TLGQGKISLPCTPTERRGKMSTPRVPRFRRNSKKFVRLEGGAQGLPRLADRLNEFQGQAPPSWGKLKRKMLGPSETEACRTVQVMLADLQDVAVTDPVPARLVAKFNKLAEELPVQLCIRQNETGVTCSSVSLRVENLGAFEAVWWLWANLHHPARL